MDYRKLDELIARMKGIKAILANEESIDDETIRDYELIVNELAELTGRDMSYYKSQHVHGFGAGDSFLTDPRTIIHKFVQLEAYIVQIRNRQISPLYAELKGYLEAAPKEGTTRAPIWESYNMVIKALMDITGIDYSRFMIEPLQGQLGNFIEVELYRQKLVGLVSVLHDEFFPDTISPLEKTPQISIVQNQKQQQLQEVWQEIKISLEQTIDEKIKEHPSESKQHGFLSKLKKCLGSIYSINQVITLILGLMKEFSLNVDDVLKIFG